LAKPRGLRSSCRTSSIGQLDEFSLECNGFRGPLLSAQSFSLRGNSLKLGLRPILIFGVPTLALLSSVRSVFSGDWLWGCVSLAFNWAWWFFALCPLFLAAPLPWGIGGSPCSLSYSYSLSSDSFKRSPLLRLALKLVLGTVLRGSLAGAALATAAGDLDGKLVEATGFDVVDVSIESGQLLTNIRATFPDEAKSKLDFVLRSRIASGAGGKSVSVLDPAVKASFGGIQVFGRTVPDIWVPIVSGAALNLGDIHRVTSVVTRGDVIQVRGNLFVNSQAPDAAYQGGASRPNELPPT